MNTKHQVLNGKMNLFLLLKPSHLHMQMQMQKNPKKTSHTKIPITEISQSSHDRKAGHACGMTKKGYVLVNLGQFESEIPLNSMQI